MRMLGLECVASTLVDLALVQLDGYYNVVLLPRAKRLTYQRHQPSHRRLIHTASAAPPTITTESVMDTVENRGFRGSGTGVT